MNLTLIINTFTLLPNFRLCQESSSANCGKNHKGVPLLLPQQFLNDLNHMLNTNIKDALNHIRISISSMKKSYLKNYPRTVEHKVM